MANSVYGFTALTGSGAGSLAAIDGDLLVDGDIAVGVVSGVSYVYHLDAASGLAEASPSVISPIAHAGTKRWELGDDGITLAIYTQAALDGLSALSPAPTRVVIAPGTYYDVTITLDDATLVLSEGVVFKTSAAGKVPAIKFSGCDRLEIQGRIVADGNKANNAHAYTDAEIGYAYATVAVYNSSYLQVGDIYVYNAWHDGVNLDTVSFSKFGDIVAKDSYERGVLLYQSTNNNHINSITVNTTDVSKGVRTGGAAAGSPTDKNQIGAINIYNAQDGVLIERYTSSLQIGKIISDTIPLGNGVKIEDATYIDIGSIIAKTVGYNGFFINASQADASHINVGRVTVTDAGTENGSYSGVFISSNIGNTAEKISIGQMIADSCGTTVGYGLRIENDGDVAGSVIQNVNIGNIITTANVTVGVFIDDKGTNQNIALGDIVSSGNGSIDFRVEYGVKNVSWGNAVVGSANNQMGNNVTLVGNRIVLDASAAAVSTVGSGEDNLAVKTIGSGVMGATSGIHIVAAGTKTNANGNKTLKLYFGATSWTFHAASNDEANWFVEAWIFNITASTQKVTIIASGTGTASTESSTSAIDTAANVTVRITGECASSSDVITQTLWFMERL